MLIPLAAIDPAPDNVRRIAASLDDDEALQKSIASMGVLQPILVIRQGERYRLIDGERRARLAAQVGLLEIAAEIAPRADEGWATAAAAAANMVRAEMHPVDRWRIMARLQQQGYTLPAASAALGLTERAGKRLDRLSKLHPDIIAHLERGDWPEDDELAVIANSDPGRQAAALANPRALIQAGPSKGCANWHAVAVELREVRIPISRAIFDTAVNLTVDWREDLFAEPGSGEEEFTTDSAAFLAAQKAALATKIATPPKGVKFEAAKTDQHGAIKIPAGMERDFDGSPDKPKRGRTVLFSIDEKGGAFGKVTSIVIKPKPGKKAETPPEDDTDPEVDDAHDHAEPEEPAAPAEPPAGITKFGLTMIAEAKTQALRTRLAQQMTANEVIAGLVLLLTAPNVSVRGVDYDINQGRLDDLRLRLVLPTGFIYTNDGAALVDIGAEALRRCLSVAKPDAEKASHRVDSGEVAEWLGHNLVAGDELPRFDTPEFLETISAGILRKIAIEHGHKPAAQAADLRRQLAGHLPDWRPAAAQFGAPGPKVGRREG